MFDSLEARITRLEELTATNEAPTKATVSTDALEAVSTQMEKAIANLARLEKAIEGNAKETSKLREALIAVDDKIEKLREDIASDIDDIRDEIPCECLTHDDLDGYADEDEISRLDGRIDSLETAIAGLES